MFPIVSPKPIAWQHRLWAFYTVFCFGAMLLLFVPVSLHLGQGAGITLIFLIMLGVPVWCALAHIIPERIFASRVRAHAYPGTVKAAILRMISSLLWVFVLGMAYAFFGADIDAPPGSLWRLWLVLAIAAIAGAAYFTWRYETHSARVRDGDYSSSER